MIVDEVLMAESGRTGERRIRQIVSPRKEDAASNKSAHARKGKKGAGGTE